MPELFYFAGFPSAARVLASAATASAGFFRPDHAKLALCLLSDWSMCAASLRCRLSAAATVKKTSATKEWPSFLQLAHFDRVANWLVTIVELMQAIVERSDVATTTLEFGSSFGLAVFTRQLAESFDGDRVRRIGCDESIECLAFRRAIASPRGQPGLNPIDLGHARHAGWQVEKCLVDGFGAVGGHRPVETRSPYWRVVGATPQAGIEQMLRRIERPGSDGEVSLAEPHAVVVWGKRPARSRSARTTCAGAGTQYNSRESRARLTASSEASSPVSCRCCQRSSIKRWTSSSRPCWLKTGRSKMRRAVRFTRGSSATSSMKYSACSTGRRQPSGTGIRDRAEENEDPGVTLAHACSAAWFRPRIRSQTPSR